MKQLNFRLSRAARLLAGLTLLTGVWVPPMDGPPAPAASPPPAPRSPTAIVYVDRTDDNASAAAKMCTAAPNDCTLRGAIEKVNAAVSINNTIFFSSSVTVVTPVTPTLPVITKEGTWIIGSGSLPKVDALALSGGDVFTINANNTQITGLSIVNGPSSGGYADIRVIGGTGNLINANYLGIAGPGATGSGCYPPGVVRNSAYGVVVTGTVGASGAYSGTYIVGNTIVCHGSHGVAVFGSDYVYVGEASGGVGIGNYIGVTAQGTNWPNSGSGVAFLAQGTNGVRLGVIRDNTIANNAGHGIWLAGTGTANSSSTYSNHVRGNRIGLDANGPKGNELHGVAVSNAAYLNQIGGVTAAERNVIAANTGSGVQIIDGTSNGILGNYIGTDLNGAGDLSYGNGSGGVYILSGNTNIIGGYLLTRARNVIANNTFNGIALYQPPGVYTLANTIIEGNYIGTDVTGTFDHGNFFGSGITLSNIASGVITGNVISGNTNHGIHLQNTAYFSVTNNLIGTNVTGTAAIENGLSGVSLVDGSTGNHVGGTATGTRNVISGNRVCGVALFQADNNDIRGNFIGLNQAGTAAVPNQDAGVCVSDSDSNDIGLIGGLAQYISGNLKEGIRIENGSTGNFVLTQNYIGVGSDGGTPLGNGLAGILISQSASNHVFAGIVAHNGGPGIAVTGTTALQNVTAAYIIRHNAGLPVDLGIDGHTPNDNGDGDSGPNGLQNYPVITAQSGSTIVGTACANCLVNIYEAVGNPTGNGGGGIFSGQAVADGSGVWSDTLTGGLTASDVTLQAWAPNNATSEFSPRGPGRLYLPLILK